MINKRRVHSVPIVPKISSSNSLSNIKETIVSGIGFGIGSGIANRAVSSILGPREIEIQHQISDNKCKEFMTKYEKCMKQNINCVNELEEFQICLKNK